MDDRPFALLAQSANPVSNYHAGAIVATVPTSTLDTLKRRPLLFIIMFDDIGNTKVDQVMRFDPSRHPTNQTNMAETMTTTFTSLGEAVR